MIKTNAKIPLSDTTIFTVMSEMAKRYNAINLGQGFPDFDCDIKLKQRAEKYLQMGKNQYCPMPGLLDLRQAICNKINASYEVQINPSQICLTAGATQALFTAIIGFINKGDEVIIIEPAYDCYKPSILIAGGIPRVYSMTYPKYSVDWNVLEKMINDKTKMIIINTPHNPTGTILEKEDLEALEQIVSEKDIIVLSDEVYEHIVFDKKEHHSVIRFPKLFNQSLAIFSFGKTFHNTGWKLGYCIGPNYLINQFKNIHQWNVFCVNSFLQYALAEHLEEDSSYNDLSSFFQEKRDFLTRQLQNTPLKPILSKGTYFQLFNYERIDARNDRAFAEYLTKEIGVATIPLSPFYSEPPQEKVIRFCFAKKTNTLMEAAKRLEKLRV